MVKVFISVFSMEVMMGAVVLLPEELQQKPIHHLPHICPCGLKLRSFNSLEVMMRKECVCAQASVCVTSL